MSRDFLRKTIKKLITKYETKKTRDHHSKENKGSIDDVISWVYKEMYENLEAVEKDVNEYLKECLKHMNIRGLFGGLITKGYIKLRKLHVKLQELYERMLLYKGKYQFITEENELEKLKRSMKLLGYPEEVINYYLEKERELIKERRKILDELVNIAEREGIEKVRENFSEYYKLAIKKVYPKSEDYIDFRKKECELRCKVETLRWNHFVRTHDYLLYYSLDTTDVRQCGQIKVELIKEQRLDKIVEDAQEIYGTEEEEIRRYMEENEEESKVNLILSNEYSKFYKVLDNRFYCKV